MAPASPAEVEALGPPVPADERYDDDPLTCAWLTAGGQCSTYETRPLVCRLFGAVRGMRCPHGCRPQRWPRARHERRWHDEVFGNEAGVLLLTAEGAITPERGLELVKKREG